MDMKERLAEVGRDTENAESAFSKRIRELQGVSETTSLLAKALGDIEKKLLGPSQEPAAMSDRPAYQGGSLNDDLEMYTNRTILSLQVISDSVQRLGQELGGVSEIELDYDRPPIA